MTLSELIHSHDLQKEVGTGSYDAYLTDEKNRDPVMLSNGVAVKPGWFG